jgi:hypothetical protein
MHENYVVMVITMLMSLLQDVGSYMGGGAYENPNMAYLISTLIDARKLCSLVVSMLMSILQYVGLLVYIRGVLMRIPLP